jgi:hypothetical protein
MDQRSFYDENKYCAQCRTYVRYLMSVQHSYCVHCGHEVKLFDDGARKRFAETLEKKKHRAS